MHLIWLFLETFSVKLSKCLDYDLVFSCWSAVSSFLFTFFRGKYKKLEKDI